LDHTRDSWTGITDIRATRRKRPENLQPGSP